jgi:hypothetical protein
MPPLIGTGTTGSSQHFNRRTRSSAARTVFLFPLKLPVDHAMAPSISQHGLIENCGFDVVLEFEAGGLAWL